MDTIRPLFDLSALPPRGADGFVWHPDMDDRWQHPVLGEEYFDTLKLAEEGFAWTERSMDPDDPAFVQAQEDCDCSGWRPPDLAAEGFRLVAIFDHEDNGPSAMYVRPVSGAEQEALIAKEREVMDKLMERHGKGPA